MTQKHILQTLKWNLEWKTNRKTPLVDKKKKPCGKIDLNFMLVQCHRSSFFSIPHQITPRVNLNFLRKHRQMRKWTLELHNIKKHEIQELERVGWEKLDRTTNVRNSFEHVVKPHVRFCSWKWIYDLLRKHCRIPHYMCFQFIMIIYESRGISLN